MDIFLEEKRQVQSNRTTNAAQKVWLETIAVITREYISLDPTLRAPLAVVKQFAQADYMLLVLWEVSCRRSFIQLLV